ncbi:hypothetical protein DET65_3033 [Sunxiuqinia elliptica]|uniref:Uncharacterized protein n=1 Tax=Sunxiuqinia elliptica TaxID=655355 RepID=A0A4R6H3K6_9BACT|nr:hypothetical protein DET52_104219 [Sunxiuqinia elliptica]TDO58509.1 hypothetical protein DET65_3033 [Sunxiuqinia elliptica]
MPDVKSGISIIKWVDWEETILLVNSGSGKNVTPVF